MPALKLFSRGKVRDNYEIDGCLLIVATDRISAFDVVMPNPIPGKGAVLTRLSAFWFRQMEGVIQNHMISTDVDDYPAPCRSYRNELLGRSMLVKKAKPLPGGMHRQGIPCGFGWKDYVENRTVSGVRLPRG